MKRSFIRDVTVGERRGLIALLTFILIVVGVAAICNHCQYVGDTSTDTGECVSSSAASDSVMSSLVDDDKSAGSDAAMSRSSRRDARRGPSKKASVKPQLPRNPRDEQVN